MPTRRRSGGVQRVPVIPVTVEGVDYLVCPRGETQWVRNLRAQPQLVLVHGRRRHTLLARELAEAEKPALLRIYLQRFAPTVQRYFAVTPDAPTAAFAAVGPAYPVFELTPCG